jgi:hypothetical protein
VGARGRHPGDRPITALLTAAPRAAGAPPRVLLVAPFARGAAHGGSLRATAMAERLEARGAHVSWAVAPVHNGGRAAKLRSLLRGEPAVVRTHTQRLPSVGAGWDAVIASHSYLAPVLERVAPPARRLVDFHNLEWRVLADTGRAEGGAHGGYLGVQARLMRRFERAVLRGGAAAVATPEEHAWAARLGAADAVVVPNTLSRAAVAEAERTAMLRASRTPATAPLVYLGTLTFPPNVRALLTFLERAWPAVRAAEPAAELLVAGRCAPDVAAAVARHRGVRPLGFVEDLPQLLAGAAAAVLPFDGRGGSSLRCLHYGLAEIPVIAAPAAARGLPFSPGLIAAGPGAWARAVTACRAGAPEVTRAVAVARDGARAVQADEAPWDALWHLMRMPAVVA